MPQSRYVESFRRRFHPLGLVIFSFTVSVVLTTLVVFLAKMLVAYTLLLPTTQIKVTHVKIPVVENFLVNQSRQDILPSSGLRGKFLKPSPSDDSSAQDDIKDGSSVRHLLSLPHPSDLGSTSQQGPGEERVGPRRGIRDVEPKRHWFRLNGTTQGAGRRKSRPPSCLSKQAKLHWKTNNTLQLARIASIIQIRIQFLKDSEKPSPGRHPLSLPLFDQDPCRLSLYLRARVNDQGVTGQRLKRSINGKTIKKSWRLAALKQLLALEDKAAAASQMQPGTRAHVPPDLRKELSKTLHREFFSSEGPARRRRGGSENSLRPKWLARKCLFLWNFSSLNVDALSFIQEQIFVKLHSIIGPASFCST